MKTKISTALFLCPILGWADVNMKDASFLHQMNEIPHPIFSKTYNSRSLHRGAFGFGWCAEFEKCKTLQKGVVATFNPQGRLIRYHKPGFPVAHLSYNRWGFLEKIRIGRRKFQIDWAPGHERIVRIQSDARLSVSYFYEQQNLVKIENQNKETFSFQYDSFQNLIEIQNPQKRNLKIRYDSQKDEVVSVQASSGCQETYQFKKNRNNELHSTLERSCPSQPKLVRTFVFTAKPSEKGLLLSQIKKIGGSNVTATLP